MQIEKKSCKDPEKLNQKWKKILKNPQESNQTFILKILQGSLLPNVHEKSNENSQKSWKIECKLKKILQGSLLQDAAAAAAAADDDDDVPCLEEVARTR